MPNDPKTGAKPDAKADAKTNRADAKRGMKVTEKDPIPAADVRAVSTEEVRVDARESMSYKEYAAQRTEPIITVQRIIDRKGLPLPKKFGILPNMEVKQVVKWGELPKEEPPKPDRTAATVKSYILHIPTPRKPPPPGIASIEPPGR